MAACISEDFGHGVLGGSLFVRLDLLYLRSTVSVIRLSAPVSYNLHFANDLSDCEEANDLSNNDTNSCCLGTAHVPDRAEHVSWGECARSVVL